MKINNKTSQSIGFIGAGNMGLPMLKNLIKQGYEVKVYDINPKITKKLEKYPFIKDKVNDQTKLLKNMLKSYGYYFVKLNTEYIENDNNSINSATPFHFVILPGIVNTLFPTICGKQLFEFIQ